MMTAPFRPGDTVVRVVPPPDPDKFRGPHVLPDLPIGSIWTVERCHSIRVYRKSTGEFFHRPDRWAVHLVGIDHPPWQYDPTTRVGYKWLLFRLAIATDISALQSLLTPRVWEATI